MSADRQRLGLASAIASGEYAQERSAMNLFVFVVFGSRGERHQTWYALGTSLSPAVEALTHAPATETD